MNNGWVKLPRGLLDGCVLRQPEILQVFIYALLQARFRSTVVSVKGHTVALDAGQCIFGRTAWAYELHISQSVAYRALHKLEEYGLIKIKTTAKYTVLTIVDWESYNDSVPQQVIEQITDSKPTEQSLENKGQDGISQQINEQQTNSKPTQEKKDNNINNNIYNTAFEKFWDKYPNKFNRAQTHKNFVKAAKAHGTEAILTALDKYLAEIEAKGTAAEYIIRSTNFVGQKAYFLGYLELVTEEVRGDDIPETTEDVITKLMREGGFDAGA